ncbi:MAG: SLC13 family permease [Promethearchaeota archaeon]
MEKTKYFGNNPLIMALQLIAQLVILGLFLLMTVIYSFKKLDIGAYSIVIAFVAVVFTLLWENHFNLEPENVIKEIDFFGHINYQVILYLIFMEIVIFALQEQRIFQWLSLKIIRVTKGNPRAFFYLMSVVSTILSGFMEDVSLAITCRVLEIKARPFILGISFSIILGNLLSPFATGTNIIIAQAFGLNIGWFLTYFIGLLVVLETFLLVFIDLAMVKKQAPPSERQKTILLEIMNPDLLISEKSKFVRYLVYFAIIITGLVFSFYFPAYLVVMIASVFLCLVERTKHSLSDYFDDIDWKLILFLVSIFLMIGCMDINGSISTISNFVQGISSDNGILTIIIILVVSSIISSFISKSLMGITFSTVLLRLFIGYIEGAPTVDQSLQIMALIIGVVLGGNLIPPAATHLLKAIEIAEENYVKGFTFRYFTKYTVIFSGVSIVLGLGYISLIMVIF